MLHLSDVLEFVVDGLYDSPLSGQQPVRHAHHSPLHVALELRYQLDAVNKEALEEVLPDISLVPDKLSVQEIHKCLVVKRLSVVNIPGGYHEVQQLAPLIADEVQLEAEEPAHGAFASLGYALERPVDMDALILAHPERGAVNEADARAFAQEHLLDEQRQGNGDLPLQLDEAVIGHQAGEQVAEMLRDMLQIEVLQASVAGAVEQDHDQHDFCLGQRPVAVILPLFRRLYRVFCHHRIKKLAKIICHTENFSNFVLGKH